MGGTRILKKTYFNGRNFRGKIFSCFPGHEKKIVKINFSKKRFRHLSGNKFPRKKNLIFIIHIFIQIFGPKLALDGNIYEQTCEDPKIFH